MGMPWHDGTIVCLTGSEFITITEHVVMQCDALYRESDDIIDALLSS